MQIIPSVLVYTFAEFKRQVHKMEEIFPFIQVDVMDGHFVQTISFPEVDKINEIQTPLKYEVHLMVADPVAELRKWQSVEKVFRVLFPAEAKNPKRTISFIRKEGWEMGMVLNPKTPLSAITEYLPLLDVVQFMTVEPGKQGSPFLSEVLEKIKTFTALPQRPLCAVDGAVNKDTIKMLKDAGADIVYPGSALCQVEDARKALVELQNLIK